MATKNERARGDSPGPVKTKADNSKQYVDGILDHSHQGLNSPFSVTRRWNSMHVKNGGRRFEIPDDILSLAETEPFKPPYWRQPYRTPREICLATGEQSDPGRILTASERDALVASRPDLMEAV